MRKGYVVITWPFALLFRHKKSSGLADVAKSGAADKKKMKKESDCD